MKINRGKTIFDVLYSKLAFLNNKNIGFKNAQNWHFYKEVSPWSWSKIGNFVNVLFHAKYTQKKYLVTFHLLCFSNMDREKVFANVVDKKEPSKHYKKTLYEKRKIRIFPKGLVHRFDQKFEISSTWIFLQNRLRKSIWKRSSYQKVSIILCNSFSPPL